MIRIPLKQHVGSPNQPIVAVDEIVRRGQLIAEPNGLGARIHSSVDGVIKVVNADEICIEKHDIQSEGFVEIDQTKSNLEAIMLAGVVGAGGAGFPSHVKFDVTLEGGVIIANAAECEPVLHHNTKTLESSSDEIIRGLQYVVEMTGAAKGIVAIKPKYKEIVATLIKQASKASLKGEKIEVKMLPNMYPAGDERVIVRELLGVELAPGELPLKANAVVTNTETLKNVTRAIENRQPVITKDVTVGGKVKDSSTGRVFLEIPIGTPVNQLINECGGLQIGHGEIVLGGPFTGKRGTEDDVVTKTMGGVLVAVEFPKDTRKVGTIACECGADADRLREIAASMGAEVIAEEMCKRMTEVNGRFRCDLPGSCPGQTDKVLALRKKGAQIILTGTCED